MSDLDYAKELALELSMLLVSVVGIAITFSALALW